MVSKLKKPVSVLVVIYTPDGQCLVLERAGHPGYWQSVTGSQDGDEALPHTARREVLEETGLDASHFPLTDWALQNTFEIYPRWRDRYPEGVTHNIEHAFSLRVPKPLPIRLSPEHTRAEWLPWPLAAQRVFSDSNRLHIQRVAEQAHT